MSPIAQKSNKNEFPDEFPFWARLKIDKNRITLVIDEDKAYNKKKKRYEDGYVHRESTHSERKGFEKLYPNPDSNDPNPMYLKSPKKTPKSMFKTNNKNLSMPRHLKEKYSRNNKK